MSASQKAAKPAGQPLKDGGHLFEVEHRTEHAARPGFRISELRISPTQKVPWHFHTHVQDTFYVIEGSLRLFLREPKEEVRLGPGQSHAVAAKRPHLVANGGQSSTTFLVLQGIGEYDFVPLVEQ
jgi:mannose-6-phosphate isomerase-like protein (cupin superfamily)